MSAEGRDAVIDTLVKVVPKNKLAVELFVKIGGNDKFCPLLPSFVEEFFPSCSRRPVSFKTVLKTIRLLIIPL